MWYNSKCYTVGYGALFVSSADVINSIPLLGKVPLITDLRPADCVATSASDKGHFAMTAGDGKPCERCGTSEWYKNGNCKQCSKEYHRRWRRENAERVSECKRRWAKNNPEKMRRYRRRWRAKNPVRERKRIKRWRERNPGKVRNQQRRWRENNREACRRKARKWARANRKKGIARQNRRRALEIKAKGSFTADEFNRLCEQYDNCCLRCGRADVELTADHVIPLSWEGATNDIGNIQPLCFSCNAAKGNRHATDYRTKPMIKRWVQKRLFSRTEVQ